ncbi:MAG: GIY-YIG nuclease family protein [Candidatus Paceibacterota bacterium]
MISKKYLFWVKTGDHGEDWFIIAKNKKVAVSFHAHFEGYNSEDAKATLVCPVEKKYEKKPAYHAQIDMLKDLGFEIISEYPARVVRKDGKIYREGIVPHSVMFFVAKEKGYGVYIIKICGTDKYKIGVTNDFYHRFKNLQTGSAEELEPYYFYATDKAILLENYLHKKYKTNSIGREWFRFSLFELDCLHANILKFLNKRN